MTSRPSHTDATDATDAAPSPAESHPAHTFTLYASGGRVYASNVRDKLIDLGALAPQAQGWAYQLDGDGRVEAEGFADARQALAHIAASITFLYLDGQFTALQDLGDRARPDVRGAPQIQVALDPRGQARPAIGAAA